MTATVLLGTGVGRAENAYLKLPLQVLDLPFKSLNFIVFAFNLLIVMPLTAKYLINAERPSDGFTHLYERGRLDLTVEAMVVENPQWHPLFTEAELERARRRLRAYGYKLAR